jgi:hypothetical protein
VRVCVRARARVPMSRNEHLNKLPGFEKIAWNNATEDEENIDYFVRH